MVLNSINEFIKDGTVKSSPRDGTAYYFNEDSIPINYAKLVPGHIYSFISLHSVEEDDIPNLDQYQTGEIRKKPYFDRRPIFLSLGQEGPFEVGINLKIMPLLFRKWFLRKYLQYMYSTLEQLVDKDGNFIEVNARMRMPEVMPFYKINRGFSKLVTEQTGFNVEFLVDKYTRGEMGNPLALIDWEYVPNLCNFQYMNDGSIISKTPITYFLTKFT